MEGMRRALLTRQRVMRLECQLPKGKDRASCSSMKTTYGGLFKRYNSFGWAGSQLRQAGSLIFMWHVGSSSLTRGQTQVPCIGSMKPSPLD